MTKTNDDIAAKGLKIAGLSAAPGLTRVIDRSLPARLKSVSKKGPKIEPGTYRPICLPSIPGKILDRQHSFSETDFRVWNLFVRP